MDKRGPETVPETSPQADVSAEETVQEHRLRSERAVARSELGLKIDTALRSLARAARSFLLYDPENEAIRIFLEAWRADLVEALAAVRPAHPEGIALVVRPFEMVWEGEVVYLERDRERSLAYRMFRDGVRRLTIGAETTWEEMLVLLQILSIRFTGVRQQEEDIVTLLWKAGFPHIDIVAVEGFVPDDEIEPGSARVHAENRGRSAATHVDAPPDFDQPLPPRLKPLGPRFRPLPAEALAELRAEASSRTLPDQCVQLVRQLVDHARDPTDPTEWSDLASLVGEVRDFLLAEGQLDRLILLARLLDTAREEAPDEVVALLAGFADERALKRVVHSVAAAQTEVPEELMWLVERLPGNHLEALLVILASERSQASRRVTRQLIERFAGDDPGLLMSALRTQADAVAADLLRVIARALPGLTLDALDIAQERGEPDMLLEALKVLERATGTDIDRMRLRMLDAPLPEVRVQALAQIARVPRAGLYEPTYEIMLRRSRMSPEPEECDAFGRTLAALDPGRAAADLTECIRPKSLVRRFFRDPLFFKALQWISVTGLAELSDERHDETIRWLEARAGSDLAQHCVRVLARRRRERAHG